MLLGVIMIGQHDHEIPMIGQMLAGQYLSVSLRVPALV